jgi:hypothetical protein
VPFTKTKAAEPVRVVNFNCPKSIDDYIEEASKVVPAGSEKARGRTSVILDAIRFDKELGEKTARLAERIEAYADAHQLSIESDASTVAASLMERGLKDWEREQKGKK